MKLIKLMWRVLWNIKTVLITSILVLSLAFNATIFLGGPLYSAINNGFEAVTGIQTIASKNETELRETSAQLISQQKINRQLKTQVTSISGELAVERQAKRALKSQIANQADELETTKNALKSQLEDLAKGVQSKP